MLSTRISSLALGQFTSASFSPAPMPYSTRYRLRKRDELSQKLPDIPVRGLCVLDACSVRELCVDRAWVNPLSIKAFHIKNTEFQPMEAPREAIQRW